MPDEFVRSDVCLERHQSIKNRMDRNEDDIKDVWRAVDAIRIILQGQAIKIAYIVGGITVIVNIASLVFQFYGK